MDILPNNTVKLLKDLNKKDLPYVKISKKYGESSRERIIQLLSLKYIHMASKTDVWGKPVEPEIYGITKSGKMYIEDLEAFIKNEKLQFAGRSIIVPMLVTVATDLLINLTKVLLQLP